MRNKWFKNLSQMCQFLNKWKSEEAEAHPSVTSLKSLPQKFHLTVSSDFFFSLPLPPPSFFTGCHLFPNTTFPLNERSMITVTPVTFAFASILVAWAKKKTTFMKSRQIYMCKINTSNGWKGGTLFFYTHYTWQCVDEQRVSTSLQV